jgi:dolichol-phosphate mannosyltransferase
MPTTKELGIVIPTYNEKDNIIDLLGQIQQEVETNRIRTLVLVMDDSSPDQTGLAVEAFSKELNSEYLTVELKTRPQKSGLASAYKEGFKLLRDRVDYLMSMDADLSHKPEYLKNFIQEAQNGYDLVIGSRYIQGGGVRNWNLTRKFISKFGSFYARTILGVNIHDFTGGYNLYRSEIFRYVPLESIKADGFLFQIEMKYRLAKKTYKFIEIPIIFPDRTKGKSKMSKKIALEALLGVWRLKFSK